jgi:hypothetical protein
MNKLPVAMVFVIFCSLAITPWTSAQTDAQQCIQHSLKGQGTMAEHIFKNICNYRIGTLYEDNDPAVGGSTGNGAIDAGGTQFGGMAAYAYRIYACKSPSWPVHASGQPAWKNNTTVTCHHP